MVTASLRRRAGRTAFAAEFLTEPKETAILKQDLTIAQQMLPLLSATSGKKLLDRPELCLAQSGSIKVCYAS